MLVCRRPETWDAMLRGLAGIYNRLLDQPKQHRDKITQSLLNVCCLMKSLCETGSELLWSRKAGRCDVDAA